MLIVPRSYQVEAVNSIYSYFQENKGNPVVAMPTGTGKSVVIAMFLESIFRLYTGQKILVVTHVKELIGQNYGKLLALWPNAPAGVNSAGLKQRDTQSRIIFAGIASIAKNPNAFGKVDLVIVDEAHLVSNNEETMYSKFLMALKSLNPLLKVIGFTATPWRLGQGSITQGGIFTDTCFDITGMEAFNRLIAEGYLARLVPKRTRTVMDLSGVHIRGGEFIASELQHAVNKDEITQNALREMVEHVSDRKKWLLFCAGIEHAVDVSQALNEMGVSCGVVHSKMSGGHRDSELAKYDTGEYQAMANANVLTTGFDAPAIDFIGMLRPTASSVLWVQMLGRGTRPFPGKTDCLVHDFAGNTARLGPINDPVIPRKKGGGGGDAPVKLCEACQTYNHASVRFCVTCGAEFTFQTKLQNHASTDEIIKGDVPEVAVFEVDHIVFSIHTKMDRPPILKVAYYCGLRVFYEWVCVEHTGFAQRKARQWWKERSGTGLPLPESTHTALEIAPTLRTATHLRVWVNKQHPDILATCFDGTAFGTKEAGANTPSVETTKPPTDFRTFDEKLDAAAGGKPLSSYSSLEDDDIPF